MIAISMDTLREQDMKNVEAALRDVTNLLNYQTKFGKDLEEIKTRIINKTVTVFEMNVVGLFHETILSIISHLKDIIAIKVDCSKITTKISFEKESVLPYIQIGTIINECISTIKDVTEKLLTVQYDKL